MAYKPDTYNRKVPILDYPIRLDLGAGPYPQPGYVTLDFIEPADIVWDIKDGIPLPDNSVSELFTSHTLEHFEATDIHFILLEILRVCKNEAPVTIIVPSSDTWEGNIPPHYSLWDEHRMKAINIWRHKGDDHLQLMDFKKDGYSIYGYFKAMK